MGYTKRDPLLCHSLFGANKVFVSNKLLLYTDLCFAQDSYLFFDVSLE
jgi:hypothetical protein